MPATAEGPESTTVVVVAPVLRRSHRIRPFLTSLAAATPEAHRVVFVGTAGDRDVLAEVLAAAAEYPPGYVTLEVLGHNPTGDYARKVNHVARTSSEPFIFTAADDLDFRPGWCSAALAPFADERIGVVGTQDLCNQRTIAGAHSTHLMFRRRYVEEQGTIDAPGLVFHEGYPHEFVDDEAVETAKFRGAWRFADASVVEHLHPMNGKAPMDSLYRMQGQRMQAGRLTFRTRRKLWTPPPARPSHDNVAIIVASFGEERWAELARSRAVPSAEAERPAELIVHHITVGRLHNARNEAAGLARSEWLLFLDADDELEPGYIDAMGDTTGDLLAPSVRYVIEGEPPPAPVSFAARDMRRTNPCAIGTLVRRELFDEAEGFWPEVAWEDWSLFRRCWLLGARIQHVADAVYRAHVNPAGGRNSTVEGEAALARAIANSHAQFMRRKRAQR